MLNFNLIAVMKKFLKSLVLFAAAAMALTSCENEGLNEGITENNTFTLSFTADVPQTRTSVAIDGNAANFAWSVDAEGNLTDRVIFLQTQDANDKVNTKYSDAEESSIEEGVATFVTDFAAVENVTLYNYCAIYPETATSNPTSLESVKVTLPASQNITEGSYDPKADLMMSKLITEVEAKDGHGGNLEFTRLAAIGKMVLKGVTADEEIQSVKLTFTDKVLNGDVTLDFINGTATYAAEGNNNVEVKGAMVAEASNDIFFTCFPGTYSGAYRVDVTTDVATYYKEGNLTKDLVFSAGDVTIFGATVSNRQASNIKTYTKVTKTNLADYSGNYLLVYEAGNVAFDGSLTTFDAVNNNFAVSISDNTIVGAHGGKAFTIAKVDGGYSVQSASGYYIGQTSYANDVVESEETVYVNTITINEDGTADVACTTTGGQVIIMYNNTSGQDRFRYYKEGSSQQAIALYRENGTGSDEELVKALESIEVSGQTTTFTVDDEWVFGGTVTAKYNDGTTADVTASADVDNSEVQLDTAGEYTVNVSYTEDEVTKEFSYTVTVSNAPVAGEEQTYTVSSFKEELGLSANTDISKPYSLGGGLFTLSASKGTAGATSTPAFNNSSDQLRVYKNGTTITLSSENTIVKVVFTFSGNYKHITGANVGSYDTASYTWTGSANSITFINEGTDQARITGMTITYLGAGGEGGETPDTPGTGDGGEGGESATYTESFSGITSQKTGYTTVLSYTSTDVQIGGSYIVWSGSCAQYVGNSGKAAVAFGKNTGSYIQTTVADGLTSLTINYILPFSDTQVNFVLNVNGEDVETKKVTGLSGAGATGSVEFTGLNYSGETIIKIHQGSVSTRSGIASIVWTNNN